MSEKQLTDKPVENVEKPKDETPIPDRERREQRVRSGVRAGFYTGSY